MTRQLVLVVDDEPTISRLVERTLGLHDYSVVTAANGETALGIIDSDRPDLVILDVMMPGIDGYETLRRMRVWTSVPVIMLSARGTEADRVKALQIGADDYITKPFDPSDLAARVRAVLHRSYSPSQNPGDGRLRYPGLEIDLTSRKVVVNGTDVQLSTNEWELLAQLAKHYGRVMSQRELLSRVWGPEFANEGHFLRTWISRLRAKLQPAETSDSVITTITGLGYRLDEPPQHTFTSAPEGEGARFTPLINQPTPEFQHQQPSP